MLNVRNARQRSEHDVELLQNRLSRLHQEERKALKKIEETRRRADQIIHLKIRNQNSHLRKLEEAEYAEEQRERARERLQAERGKMSGAINDKATALARQKKEDADKMRELRGWINGHLQQQQQRHLDNARHITESVKEHAAEVQRQKMQQRMAHEESLQSEVEARMVAEEMRRNRADRLVTKMEDEEEIAIERLRRTQEAQKSAYEELERALTNPPPPLEIRETALGNQYGSPEDGL